VAKTEQTERRPVTRADFVGAAMVDFLCAIAQDIRLDEGTRNRAKMLCEQWDSVSPVRIGDCAADSKKAAAGE
jgi:hypothetical protein